MCLFCFYFIVGKRHQGFLSHELLPLPPMVTPGEPVYPDGHQSPHLFSLLCCLFVVIVFLQIWEMICDQRLLIIYFLISSSPYCPSISLATKDPYAVALYPGVAKCCLHKVFLVDSKQQQDPHELSLSFVPCKKQARHSGKNWAMFLLSTWRPHFTPVTKL